MQTLKNLLANKQVTSTGPVHLAWKGLKNMKAHPEAMHSEGLPS